jgi:hypothetical protein
MLCQPNNSSPKRRSVYQIKEDSQYEGGHDVAMVWRGDDREHAKEWAQRREDAWYQGEPAPLTLLLQS